MFLQARVRTIMLLCSAFFSVCALDSSSQIHAADAANLPELADKFVSKIMASNLPTPASGKLRVGVFAFANKSGKYPKTDFGPLGQVIQGQVESSLRKSLGQSPLAGKYSVLTAVPGLQDVFETANLDPQGIYSGTVTSVRSLLNSANIQVAIIGRFDFDSVTEISGNNARDAKVTVTVILPSTDFTVELTVQPLDILTQAGSGQISQPDPGSLTGTNSNGASPKYSVKMFWKSDENKPDSDASSWTSIPLEIATNPNSELYSVFFLKLTKATHKGKRYKIQLANKGVSQTFGDATDTLLDADRLVAAAVILDGVNSFYQDTGLIDSSGNPVAGPVVRHPSLVTKWILTAPGRALQPSPNNVVGYPNGRKWTPVNGTPAMNTSVGQDTEGARIGLGVDQRLLNGNFISPGGLGGSVQDIRGFQKNSNFADAFVFGDAAGSIAEGVGITNDVGLIAVHFYEELLPIHTPSAPSNSAAGTLPGQELKNTVFKVKVRLEPNPTEVWRIFYRYEDEVLPLNLNLQPVN